MNSSEPEIFILDATAFIRLDFPVLQTIPNVIFYTTLNVQSELKDFRSRMNIDILAQSGKLRYDSPSPHLIQKLKAEIQKKDPMSPLSNVDIEILTLTRYLQGILLSNDFALQNAAIHLDIPIKIISGNKIASLRTWQLNCMSCGRIATMSAKTCSHCGGRLKRVLIRTTKL
ncbi:MAG: hypothetical protein ACXAC8_01005 [Candidatus Hodarchaeales archaeon]